MKLRGKITVGFAAISLVSVSCAFLLLRSDNGAQKAAEETRRALRQQGFKVDLAEFDFSTSDEFRAREAALTNASSLNTPRNRDDYAPRSALLQNLPDLMTPVGSNAAILVWKQARLPGQSGEDLWPVLREALDADRTAFDDACQAALAGPIRFNLNASAGTGMLLPHLPALKRLAQTLGTRAVLELHDGNKDAGWTNLLAATRLVTAWDPEPAEISHLVRYACVTIAFNVTWQALQAEDWTDHRLAHLQHEWESVDFLRGFPETAAFTRASVVAACQLERQQPFSGMGMTLKETIRSPRYAWSAFTDYRRRLRYRHHGTYEDEKALLLHYRDRELELRRAVQGPTWSEMRQLPGVTNMIPFQSRHASTVVLMMNNRQLMLASSMYAQDRGQGVRQGLLGRAAEAEVRRRLILTTLALERYRGRHGSYPGTLQELVPDLLKNAPIDFMDGQPLRYRRTGDGRFVLYSVGLDCADNAGSMPRRRQPESLAPRQRNLPLKTDLVWPRPASDAELRAHAEEEARANEEQEQAMLARIAEEEKEAALQRERTMAKLEQLYANKQPWRIKDPTYEGRPLIRVLWNEAALPLEDLLTLKQITTGKEPDIATFEVPIRYDAVTNIGGLRLLVDADPDEEDSGGEGGLFQDCERAANGNCLLVWNTTYDPPGKHFLQARLLYEEKGDSLTVRGPLVPFVSSNLCQFDPFYSEFDSKGGILYARLPESNGTYTIELRSPSGVHVRTFTGSTSNGVIQVHWDLTDGRGNAYTNDSVDSIFHVTLPDSGRWQTLKGP